MSNMDFRPFRGFGARQEGTYPLSRARFVTEKLPPAAIDMLGHVLDAAEEPFVGITTDGRVVPDLFALQDSGFDSRPAVAAARAFLNGLNDTQRAKVQFDIEAKQWRIWTNAFPVWEPHGLLLDDLESSQRAVVLDILQASLSAKGFADTRAAMALNGALGEIIDQYRDTLREFAYFFAVFGSPSVDGPWGWQLWGHHLDVHCFILGSQVVLTPTFMGAEPTISDRGEFSGVRLFDAERAAGLDLRRSLTASQEDVAVLYRSIASADLPSELSGPADGRHQAGAGRDNQIMPYEGIAGDQLSPDQHELLVALAATYARRLPDGPASKLIDQFRDYLAQTHFAWIGGGDHSDAIYYKIHSPILLIEFDCHQGIFLDNDSPEPFHVHTIVRTPNGGDYGKDLLRQHYAHHHRGLDHVSGAT